MTTEKLTQTEESVDQEPVSPVEVDEFFNDEFQEMEEVFDSVAPVKDEDKVFSAEDFRQVEKDVEEDPEPEPEPEVEVEETVEKEEPELEDSEVKEEEKEVVAEEEEASEEVVEEESELEKQKKVNAELLKYIKEQQTKQPVVKEEPKEEAKQETPEQEVQPQLLGFIRPDQDPYEIVGNPEKLNEVLNSVYATAVQNVINYMPQMVTGLIDQKMEHQLAYADFSEKNKDLEGYEAIVAENAARIEMENPSMRAVEIYAKAAEAVRDRFGLTKVEADAREASSKVADKTAKKRIKVSKRAKPGFAKAARKSPKREKVVDTMSDFEKELAELEGL